MQTFQISRTKGCSYLLSPTWLLRSDPHLYELIFLSLNSAELADGLKSVLFTFEQLYQSMAFSSERLFGFEGHFCGVAFVTDTVQWG